MRGLPPDGSGPMVGADADPPLTADEAGQLAMLQMILVGVGAGAAAGISGLYYPSGERGFTKTYQRWITNVSIDTATFVFKEFWPNINDKFFHQKD